MLCNVGYRIRHALIDCMTLYILTPHGVRTILCIELSGMTKLQNNLSEKLEL